jgi:hypothetical protein
MRVEPSPLEIVCLACGASRVVSARARAATGECPRCGYVGWTYAEGLDGSTLRLILNGALAVPGADRPRRGAPGGAGRGRPRPAPRR